MLNLRRPVRINKMYSEIWAVFGSHTAVLMLHSADGLYLDARNRALNCMSYILKRRDKNVHRTTASNPASAARRHLT